MAKETFVIIWICFAQVYLYILISLFLNVFHSEFIGKLNVCLYLLSGNQQDLTSPCVKLQKYRCSSSYL